MNTTALLVMAAAALAFAAEPRAATDESQAQCAARAQLAERIMRHRQETDDLEATWRIATIIRNAELSRAAQGYAHDAYARPRAAETDARETAVRNFAAEALQKCLAAAAPPAD
jgi:hypothetical protein